MLEIFSGTTLAFSLFGFGYNRKPLNIPKINVTAFNTLNFSKNEPMCVPLKLEYLRKFKIIQDRLRYNLNHSKSYIINRFGVDGLDFRVVLTKLNVFENANSTPCLLVNIKDLSVIMRTGCKFYPCWRYAAHAFSQMFLGKK